MAFSVVQHQAGTQQTSSAAGLCNATAWPQNTAAGNLLVATIGFKTSATVTCSTPGWVKGASTTSPTTVGQCDLWYKPNCGASDPSPVFTVANSVIYAIHVAEISGVLKISPADTSGVGSTAIAATLTTAVSPATNYGSEFFYSGAVQNNSSASVTKTWTASTVGGGATLGADIDLLNAPTSGIAVKHSWATTGTYLTLPSITSNITSGPIAQCIITFVPPQPVPNNYQFIKAGDGMSVSEKIR